MHRGWRARRTRVCADGVLMVEFIYRYKVGSAELFTVETNETKVIISYKEKCTKAVQCAWLCLKTRPKTHSFYKKQSHQKSSLQL